MKHTRREMRLLRDHLNDLAQVVKALTMADPSGDRVIELRHPDDPQKRLAYWFLNLPVWNDPEAKKSTQAVYDRLKDSFFPEGPAFSKEAVVGIRTDIPATGPHPEEPKATAESLDSHMQRASAFRERLAKDLGLNPAPREPDIPPGQLDRVTVKFSVCGHGVTRDFGYVRPGDTINLGEITLVED